MANAVFITKRITDYDDLPEERYHFPRTYLRTAEETVGDWILYYESRRDGGSMCYFATAMVASIEADATDAEYFYAHVRDFLPFPTLVPFKEAGRYYESGLRKEDGSTNKGLFGRAVHLLPPHEYEQILQMGLSGSEQALDTSSQTMGDPPMTQERPVVQTLTLRPLRDWAFARSVRVAYDSTCALSGLRLLNGGGSCEIEAAHIRPVKDRGPDSARNGLALSRTVHWLFDKGIVSLEDDGRILKASKLMPEQLDQVLRPDGYAQLPEDIALRPHRQFLRYHRETVYRG